MVETRFVNVTDNPVRNKSTKVTLTQYDDS
jgi:hypothetical protein